MDSRTSWIPGQRAPFLQLYRWCKQREFESSRLARVGSAHHFTQNKWIERSFLPYAVILQTTPIVAIAPLIIIWLRNNTFAALVVCPVRAIAAALARKHFTARKLDLVSKNIIFQSVWPFSRLFQLLVNPITG